MIPLDKNCAELPSGNGERAVVPTIAPPVANGGRCLAHSPGSARNEDPLSGKFGWTHLRPPLGMTSAFVREWCPGRHERQRRHCIDMLGRGAPVSRPSKVSPRNLMSARLPSMGMKRISKLLYRCRLSLVDMS